MARGFKMGGGSTALGGDATPEDILIGKTAYVNGDKITGNIPDIGQIIQEITTKSQQIIIPYGYHDGTGYVQINPDDQLRLIASNIRKDITILGITGDVEEGTNTSDATATASDILSGKTAYVKGDKITGTIPSQTAKTVTPLASAQTAVSAGTYCSGNITVNAIPNQVAAKTVTPLASAQTAVVAGSYTTGAITLGAIPNQVTGGAKYATTTAQTIASAGNYVTSNITLGALSQSNLAADNILRGKTISVSNGSSNVWSVSGSNSVLKYTSGTVKGSSSPAFKRFDYSSSDGNDSMRYATINPGFTPVFCWAIIMSAPYIAWSWRNGSTAWNYRFWVQNIGLKIGYINDANYNKNYRFTSSAVDVPSGTGDGYTVNYWIFGY